MDDNEIEIRISVTTTCHCCRAWKFFYVEEQPGNRISSAEEYGKEYTDYIYDNDGNFYCQECYDYREEHEGECE